VKRFAVIVLMVFMIVCGTAIVHADRDAGQCYNCNNKHTLWVDYGEYHRWECGMCGEVGNDLPHDRSCKEPSACDKCGNASYIEKMNIVHSGGTDYFDKNYHHAWCWCGEIDQMDAHWMYCDSSSVCHGCSAVDVNFDVWHFYQDGVCQWCGEVEPLPPILPGDPTGDGNVDIFDALAILQFAVGWEIEVNQEAGDVNDDGKCDIFDALLILQYSVGWDVELK